MLETDDDYFLHRHTVKNAYKLNPILHIVAEEDRTPPVLCGLARKDNNALTPICSAKSIRVRSSYVTHAQITFYDFGRLSKSE